MLRDVANREASCVRRLSDEVPKATCVSSVRKTLSHLGSFLPDVFLPRYHPISMEAISGITHGSFSPPLSSSPPPPTLSL